MAIMRKVKGRARSERYTFRPSGLLPCCGLRNVSLKHASEKQGAWHDIGASRNAFSPTCGWKGCANTKNLPSIIVPTVKAQ